MLNSIKMKLASIPAGTFMMGNDDSPAELLKIYPFAKEQWFLNALPRHRVTIARPFHLGQCEVTVGQFRQFVNETGHVTDAEKDSLGGFGFDESTGLFAQAPRYTWRYPGFAQSDQHPVVNVTWNDADAFCRWLSGKEGRTYRLPTEAEWEYACRAGTQTLYWFGRDPEGLAEVANAADGTAKAKYGWSKTIQASDGYVSPAPVESFRPNAFGLQDMHANVGEWCADWYDDGYYEHSPERDPPGPAAGAFRVIRGGGWNDFGGFCGSARRLKFAPAAPSYDIGFRVLLESGLATPQGPDAD
jgi:formylglycine-generating enzyme required for sulfatase activity